MFKMKKFDEIKMLRFATNIYKVLVVYLFSLAWFLMGEKEFLCSAVSFMCSIVCMLNLKELSVLLSKAKKGQRLANYLLKKFEAEKKAWDHADKVLAHMVALEKQGKAARPELN